MGEASQFPNTLWSINSCKNACRLNGRGGLTWLSVSVTSAVRFGDPELSERNMNRLCCTPTLVLVHMKIKRRDKTQNCHQMGWNSGRFYSQPKQNFVHQLWLVDPAWLSETVFQPNCLKKLSLVTLFSQKKMFKDIISIPNARTSYLDLNVRC